MNIAIRRIIIIDEYITLSTWPSRQGITISSWPSTTYFHPHKLIIILLFRITGPSNSKIDKHTDRHPMRCRAAGIITICPFHLMARDNYCLRHSMDGHLYCREGSAELHTRDEGKYKNPKFYYVLVIQFCVRGLSRSPPPPTLTQAQYFWWGQMKDTGYPSRTTIQIFYGEIFSRSLTLYFLNQWV